jgi:hypothetical protein
LARDRVGREGVVRSATLPADLRSPPGRSFQTSEPVFIRNLHEQEDFTVSDLLRQHAIVSLVNVPVLIAGAAWGVLEVDSTSPRDFSQDTIEFLTAARRAHRRIRTAPHFRAGRCAKSAAVTHSCTRQNGGWPKEKAPPKRA